MSSGCASESVDSNYGLPPFPNKPTVRLAEEILNLEKKLFKEQEKTMEEKEKTALHAPVV